MPSRPDPEDPAQADLFGAPAPAAALPVPGLTVAPALIDMAQERALIAAIDAAPLAPFRFQGWEGKRLTASYGWHYDFDRAEMGQADPIPAIFLPIRDRAAAFAGLAADELVQMLLIRYDPGAGIGWHRDRPVFDHVVGISLGNPATLRLRRREGAGFCRAALPLEPRGVYQLDGEARRSWEHSIVAMDAPRWSITFRSLTGSTAPLSDQDLGVDGTQSGLP